MIIYMPETKSINEFPTPHPHKKGYFTMWAALGLWSPHGNCDGDRSAELLRAKKM